MERRAAGRLAKRSGQAFENLFTAAIAPMHGVCLARCHPETKMLPGRRMIFVKKNGVDFVGSVGGVAIALELKRLAGGASLSGTKGDSTRAEAGFLRRFAVAGGTSAFVIHDPELDRVYVVPGAKCGDVEVGGRIALRTRDGEPLVPCWHRDERGDVARIRAVLLAIADGKVTP